VFEGIFLLYVGSTRASAMCVVKIGTKIWPKGSLFPGVYTNQGSTECLPVPSVPFFFLLLFVVLCSFPLAPSSRRLSDLSRSLCRVCFLVPCLGVYVSSLPDGEGYIFSIAGYFPMTSGFNDPKQSRSFLTRPSPMSP